MSNPYKAFPTPIRLVRSTEKLHYYTLYDFDYLVLRREVICDYASNGEGITTIWTVVLPVAVPYTLEPSWRMTYHLHSVERSRPWS